MSDVAIKVEHLGKKYLIGHNAGSVERNTTFREAMSKGVKDFVRKSRDMLRGEQIVQGESVEEFWALRDISFEIKKGEAVGIIGRNGAGKSTLLKILSRITEPTNGRITITGRVASLLEVGTGFHPELSGRENIYLNGTILGMHRKEIANKFDQIVSFSEIEKFIDTPVKRYSSGMYVRLAFSVAAFLEPEILIVDEVLAVGDTEFQKKCITRMNDVSASGRTVLFVSHDLVAVSKFCKKGLYLVDGEVTDFSDIDSVKNRYLNFAAANCHDTILNGKFLKRATLFIKDSGFTISATVEIPDDFIEPVLGIVIKTSDGVYLHGLNNRHLSLKISERGAMCIEFEFKELPLYGDRALLVDLYFGDSENNVDIFIDCLKFTYFSSTFSKAQSKIPQRSINLLSPRMCNVRVTR